MADIFNNEEVVSLLKNKHLLFMGDSNIRAQYKDLVWLLNTNTIIEADFLKRKLEKSFLGDKLVKRSELHRGRDFEEVRSYMAVKLGIKIDYMFITKCFNRDIEQLFNDFKSKKNPAPSIIVMNSCLWDLTRWGPDGANLYKQNMKKLMKLFEECLPITTLVIWTTALPVASSQIRGGLLIKQIEFLKYTLRFHVMEANHFARSIVSSHGYDVLDVHHHMRYQVHRRGNDGVHYLPVAVRYMTNLLLTHIALSWDCPLPGRVNSMILEKMRNSDCVQSSPDTDIKLRSLENIAQCTSAGLKNPDTTNKLLKSTVQKALDNTVKSVVQKAVDNAVLTKTIGPERRKKRFRSRLNNPYNTGQR